MKDRDPIYTLVDGVFGATDALLDEVYMLVFNIGNKLRSRRIRALAARVPTSIG